MYELGNVGILISNNIEKTFYSIEIIKFPLSIELTDKLFYMMDTFIISKTFNLFLDHFQERN